MLRMTLHGVEVTADSPDEAVGLLHDWAADGRIEIPPVPPVPTFAQISEAVKKLEAHAIPLSDMEKLNQLFLDRIRGLFTTGSGELRSMHTPLPSVPAPAKPSPRKAAGTATEHRPCGVCDEKFECPVGSRLVTCKDHRLKPGENLGTARKKYQAATAKTRTKSAPKRTPDVATAKGLLGRPPIRPSETTKPCSSCGDKTRLPELDVKDRCRDCRPIGEPA